MKCVTSLRYLKLTHKPILLIYSFCNMCNVSESICVWALNLKEDTWNGFGWLGFFRMKFITFQHYNFLATVLPKMLATERSTDQIEISFICLHVCSKFAHKFPQKHRVYVLWNFVNTHVVFNLNKILFLQKSLMWNKNILS